MLSDLDLMEKVFVIEEFNKLEQLMMVKENELRRADQFEQNRQYYKNKQKEIDELER